MQEIILDRLVYLIENPILTRVIVFVSGFLATRIIAAERRPGTIGLVIIGLMGFFLGHFMLSYLELNEYFYIVCLSSASSSTWAPLLSAHL